MTEYRKKKGVEYDTWHFCTNCDNWPTKDYDTKTTRPSDGELCNQCKSKEKDKTCKTT